MFASRLSFLVIPVLLLVGCATPATQQFSYLQPSAAAPTNVIVVNKPFEDAWNDMIKRMTVSQYRINNIEKASRIINLEYQIDDPAEVSKYVDCGTVTNRISHKGKERVFNYSDADSRPYSILTSSEYDYWSDITPSSVLGGTVNVYMSPADVSSTEVSVNVRYRVTRSFKSEVYSLRRGGDYLFAFREKLDPVSVVFTTQQPGGREYHGLQISCRSTGFIERQFIDYAKQ